MLLQAEQVPPQPDSGTVAPFYFPASIAVDTTGNLYIADSGTSQVREVKTDGSAAIIAGTGVAGFSGDGGPAVSAQLNKPLGIAIESSGNILCRRYRQRARSTDLSHRDYHDSRRQRH